MVIQAIRCVTLTFSCYKISCPICASSVYVAVLADRAPTASLVVAGWTTVIVYGARRRFRIASVPVRVCSCAGGRVDWALYAFRAADRLRVLACRALVACISDCCCPAAGGVELLTRRAGFAANATGAVLPTGARVAAIAG